MKNKKIHWQAKVKFHFKCNVAFHNKDQYQRLMTRGRHVSLFGLSVVVALT